MDYTINTKDFKIKDSEFLNSNEFLLESNGSENFKDQWILFDCKGIEIMVNFNLSIYAEVFEESGDYWTAPSYSINIKNIDIDIQNIYVDEYELSLCDYIKSVFVKFIKQLI
jgi:hypothetical protein